VGKEGNLNTPGKSKTGRLEAWPHWEICQLDLPTIDKTLSSLRTEGFYNLNTQGGATMSKTLNMVDHLMARAEYLEQLGQWTMAIDLLIQVAELKRLPKKTRGLVHGRLGKLFMDCRQATIASRHFEWAVYCLPQDAQLHYQMAISLIRKKKRDPQEACYHLYEAICLKPDEANYLAAYGLLLARMRKRSAALVQLRAAAKLAPDYYETLRQIAKGFRLVGAIDDAENLLRAARFRNPKDPQVQNLWSDFQIEQIRVEAEKKQLPVIPVKALEPFIVKFPSRRGKKPASPSVRIDSAAPLPAPKKILSLHRPDQRHAQ
jgi:tetratricopeptide (TPR) repeat protein